MKARRKLIAKVIRDGFKKLESKPNEAVTVVHDSNAIQALVAKGEGTDVEFKSTLRVNLHTNENDVKMEHAALKTIAAFLNTRGGTLVVGVNDAGEALGIGSDKFPNEDKMNLHLVNIIKDRIGTQHMLHIQPYFGDFGGERVLIVDCKEAYSPVYLKEKKGTERFYVRTGAATSELAPSQIHSYVNQRF